MMLGLVSRDLETNRDRQSRIWSFYKVRENDEGGLSPAHHRTDLGSSADAYSSHGISF